MSSFDPDAPSTALALREPDAIVLSDDVGLQKLWLATQRRAWRSVAVLATHEDVDTMHVAETLARLAWSYRGKPSCVFDLRDLSLRLVEYHQNEVHAQADAGNCVVVALSCTSRNPTAIPIARSVDAVVLCIDLGVASMKAAERTLDEVGRDRVLGAIVVQKKRSGRPKKA